MDPTKASITKPRCRLFDRAIKSVKNQSSTSKLKMSEVVGHDPAIKSVKNKSSTHKLKLSKVVGRDPAACVSSQDGTPINSQSLVKTEKSSEMQYSSVASVKVEYQSLVKTEEKSSEVQYSSVASEKAGYPRVNDFSFYPCAETERKCLVDSLSHGSNVDYNLPLTSSTVQYSSVASANIDSSRVSDFSFDPNAETEGKFSVESVSHDSNVDYNLPLTSSPFFSIRNIHVDSAVKETTSLNGNNLMIIKNWTETPEYSKLQCVPVPSSGKTNMPDACSPLLGTSSEDTFPKDGSRDSFESNSSHNSTFNYSKSPEAVSESEFEEYLTRSRVNSFFLQSLCENCFQDYTLQYPMFMAEFKSRNRDSSNCTCNSFVANTKSDSMRTSGFIEDLSVEYSLPRFSSPDFNNDVKNFDLSLSPLNDLPASTVCDWNWNLSELPSDFSLPISNSCCEWNRVLDDDVKVCPSSPFAANSSNFTENCEFERKLGQEGNEKASPDDGTEKSKEELDKTQDAQCSVPQYESKLLYSSKFDHTFIDAHCHLDFLFQKMGFKGTFSEYKSLNEHTFPRSYEGCVAVFCDPITFSRKRTWKIHLEEENVWGTFGCHPHFSRFYCEKYDNALLEALSHPKVRALGEIGLDYSKNNRCLKETQQKVFRHQLKICVSLKLPLVLHCRDSHDDTLKIAKEILPHDQKIHLHCFTDTWEWAKEWMDAFPNLCIGFTNYISSSSARDANEIMKKMPLDRLLLETDAPYFLPKEAQVKRWSNPGMAIHVAAQIAAIKNISIDQVLYWTRRNTNNVYGI